MPEVSLGRVVIGGATSKGSSSWSLSALLGASRGVVGGVRVV
jgi:hypothetical protein